MPNFNNLMTLGELIDALEAVDDKTKTVITSGGTYVSGFSSYRGDYEELALVPEPGGQFGGLLNVGDLLEAAKKADGGTFTGWKGGEYRMSRANAIWLAAPGYCPGIGLKKIRETEYNVILYGKRTTDS